MICPLLKSQMLNVTRKKTLPLFIMSAFQWSLFPFSSLNVGKMSLSSWSVTMLWLKWNNDSIINTSLSLTHESFTLKLNSFMRSLETVVQEVIRMVRYSLCCTDNTFEKTIRMKYVTSSWVQSPSQDDLHLSSLRYIRSYTNLNIQRVTAHVLH